MEQLQDYPKAERVRWRENSQIFLVLINLFLWCVQAYRVIVAAQPANTEAYHNLCLMLVEQEKLTAADQCLEGLALLRPNDENYLNTR